MAAQPLPSWFPVLYDRPAYTEGTNEFLAWQAKMLTFHSIETLESFVAKEIGNHSRAEFVDVADGSYNMIFRFKFLDSNISQLVVLRPQAWSCGCWACCGKA